VPRSPSSLARRASSSRTEADLDVASTNGATTPWSALVIHAISLGNAAIPSADLGEPEPSERRRLIGIDPYAQQTTSTCPTARNRVSACVDMTVTAHFAPRDRGATQETRVIPPRLRGGTRVLDVMVE
jgi:hypothetical protein